MSETLKKYGKQPQFKTWAMISDQRGFRFQEWDELDETMADFEHAIPPTDKKKIH